MNFQTNLKLPMELNRPEKIIIVRFVNDKSRKYKKDLIGRFRWTTKKKYVALFKSKKK